MLEGALLMFSFKLTEAKNYFEKIKDKHPHYLLMHVLTVYSDTAQNQAGEKAADESLYKYVNKLLKTASANAHLQDDVLSFNKKNPLPSKCNNYPLVNL